MTRNKSVFVCEACGAQQAKWQGQCSDCGAWNTLVEARIPTERSRQAQFSGRIEAKRLDAVRFDDEQRIGSGLAEFDRVLGGGWVPGSVVLIGGEPGIGKSTLLLTALAQLGEATPTCYVTGEESLEQVALRARRLGVASAPIDVLAETCVEHILAQFTRSRPRILVVDSIQTLYSEALQSAPGSVSQVREAAAQLLRFSKANGVTTVLVGHVTKEGTIAGPRVLEHMVDTVLYFENDTGSRYRIVRTVKNRFGAANEMGFFVMSDGGFKQVKNPSAIFLTGRDKPVPGAVTLITREGTRPVLVEVQALVDQGTAHTPRRLAQGFDGQRLGLLLAVLHRHCGINVADSDVYANVVGGMRVTETASDLAVILSVVSSLREQALEAGLAVFGEIGLTGEIRPVPFGEERIAEAVKHGFERILLPKANVPKAKTKIPRGVELVPVERVGDAIRASFN